MSSVAFQNSDIQLETCPICNDDVTRDRIVWHDRGNAAVEGRVQAVACHAIACEDCYQQWRGSAAHHHCPICRMPFRQMTILHPNLAMGQEGRREVLGDDEVDPIAGGNEVHVLLANFRDHLRAERAEAQAALDFDRIARDVRREEIRDGISPPSLSTAMDRGIKLFSVHTCAILIFSMMPHWTLFLGTLVGTLACGGFFIWLGKSQLRDSQRDENRHRIQQLVEAAFAELATGVVAPVLVIATLPLHINQLALAVLCITATLVVGTIASYIGQRAGRSMQLIYA
ncbi:MAG TPA: hypothetical protein VJK48_01025 [Chlamydiales bacterium]|nr:hypothetical protein [Chlamydiales bacterium]